MIAAERDSAPLSYTHYTNYMNIFEIILVSLAVNVLMNTFYNRETKIDREIKELQLEKLRKENGTNTNRKK
ncbi:unnamed protein product [Fructobacillus fructosus]|uniref:Holin n=1 Tax=Fructobacillus fructosus TaxID=1631 RepID=A0ABN9YRK2_9LACO|nr:unnamed protein product [Fructobacillus fructosus]